MSFNGVKVVQIAAISRNNCIGIKGEMPWHLPEDLKYFKKVTQSSVKNPVNGILGIVVMGRKTFESIGSKPLEGRINIIVSRTIESVDHPNVIVFDNLKESMEKAASLAKALEANSFYIIGGSEVFEATLEYTDEVRLTEVEIDVDDGDAFFPELPESLSLILRSERQKDENSGIDYSFALYGSG